MKMSVFFVGKKLHFYKFAMFWKSKFWPFQKSNPNQLFFRLIFREECFKISWPNFLKMAIPGLCFFIFVISIQFTINDWLRTADLWCWKQTLCNWATTTAHCALFLRYQNKLFRIMRSSFQIGTSTKPHKMIQHKGWTHQMTSLCHIIKCHKSDNF